MNNVIRMRICRQCGRQFLGGPHAWYCPECRAERKREQTNRCKRDGAVRKLGSIDHCQICGKEYIVEGGLQRYCASCAAKHLKEVDNAASLEYKKKNPEKIKKANVEFLQRNDGRMRKVLWRNRIKQLRTSAKITQRELGEAIGSSQSHVSQWELGTRRPDEKNYEKICNFFQVESLERK